MDGEERCEGREKVSGAGAAGALKSGASGEELMERELVLLFVSTSELSLRLASGSRVSRPDDD